MRARLPPDSRLVGNTLGELACRQRFGLVVLALLVFLVPRFFPFAP